jgi:ribosomal protein S18 acetylase RimI-like enzyme
MDVIASAGPWMRAAPPLNLTIAVSSPRLAYALPRLWRQRPMLRTAVNEKPIVGGEIRELSSLVAMSEGTAAAAIRVVPATADRWDDVLQLAGERGFTGGCWCMWWRVGGSREFDGGDRKDRRNSLETLVREGAEPGLVAYLGDEPVGWVALAPRLDYPRLARSAKLKPVDDQPVWSITCFYIDRRQRHRGVAEQLLRAAVDHARARGGGLVEAYPIDTSERTSAASADLYTGTLAMFERAGFHEVARRGGRPIVRRSTTGPERSGSA